MKKILLAFLGLYSTLLFSQTNKEDNEISRNWTSFTQSFDIVSENIKSFKLQASVKVLSNDSLAWAGIWARVDNKNKETGFFDNMGDRPIKSPKWQEYTIVGKINSNSKRISFGGLCSNNGDFYFDDFKIYFEDDKGVYQQVELSNPNFEKPISNETIPNWFEGITSNIQRVKEFSLSSSNDASNGEHSLKIQGRGIKIQQSGLYIGPIDDFSPQIGTLVTMLNNLSDRVKFAVKDMSDYEIDHLHDEKANRISALVMHLAAAEKYYQVFTFEDRNFNDTEFKKWGAALSLDQAGRDELKGHPIKYYLDIYKEVRKKTIEELQKRNDKWLNKFSKGASMNNHFSWFHVVEHQSSHLGQIYFLKKRIPEKQLDPIEQKTEFKN